MNFTNSASCRKTANISSLHFPGRLSGCDCRCTCVTCKTSFAPFARIFTFTDSGYIRSDENRAIADTWKFARRMPHSLPFFFSLCLPRERNAIDSAPVSGKRLHSLDQYLQRDSEFRLHAPSDLAGVSRERARDSWPTSGDIHKARTLNEHPDARRRVYGPNVLYGVVNAISSVTHPSGNTKHSWYLVCVLVRLVSDI